MQERAALRGLLEKVGTIAGKFRTIRDVKKLTASEWGREMAKKRAKKLSKKRRQQIARKAAQSRWKT